MRRKTIIYFSVLLVSVSITFVSIAVGGNGSMNENKYLKEPKERFGEKWHIIEEKKSEEYKNGELKKLKESWDNVEKRIADGTMGAETAKSIKDYLTLKRNFVESNYFIVDRELAIVPKPLKLSASEEKRIGLINKTLKAIEGRMSIQDGAKAVVQSDEKHYIVIFEFILPEGARGPDYAAKVTIDKKTGNIVQMLAGY